MLVVCMLFACRLHVVYRLCVICVLFEHCFCVCLSDACCLHVVFAFCLFVHCLCVVMGVGCLPVFRSCFICVSFCLLFFVCRLRVVYVVGSPYGVVVDVAEAVMEVRSFTRSSYTNSSH